MFKLFYNLGLAAYGGLLRAAAPFNPKARDMVQGRRGLWAQIERAMAPVHAQGAPVAWFHAASLGEFEQARPVLEALAAARPSCRIVLTFFSPSGYNIRRNYGGAHLVCYLPLDSPANARRFLDLVRPHVALFAKYEFWFNYLDQLHRRGIPTAVFSALFRPDQPFFKPWGGPWRRMLAGFDRIFVQTEASRQLLGTIHINQVQVAGDTRFDRVAANAETPFADPIIEAFAASRHIMAVGSAWPEDTAVLLPALAQANGANASAGRPVIDALIIAPHEMHEAYLAQLEATAPQPVVRYSRATPQQAAQAGTLIIDTIGKLAFIYRFARLAWVGGAFGKGLHNILEAAVYGLPVLFGRNHQRFPEAQQLIDAGAAWTIATTAEAEAVLRKLGNPQQLADASAAAKSHLERSRGATTPILQWALDQLDAAGAPSTPTPKKL